MAFASHVCRLKQFCKQCGPVLNGCHACYCTSCALPCTAVLARIQHQFCTVLHCTAGGSGVPPGTLWRSACTIKVAAGCRQPCVPNQCSGAGRGLVVASGAEQGLCNHLLQCSDGNAAGQSPRNRRQIILFVCHGGCWCPFKPLHEFCSAGWHMHLRWAWG